MKIVVLTQAYQEQLLINRYLHHLYPLVDQWIITCANLSPFYKAPQEDNTRQLIQEFVAQHDTKGKIKFLDTPELSGKDREGFEGSMKNYMLENSDIEHGDLLIIGDVDEFWDQDRFEYVCKLFTKNDKIENIPIEEWQFAYNLDLCFEAEHSGRFIRYVNGSKFGNTNHFIYPDGRDVTKDYKYLLRRAITQMCHLCWVKNPELIKQKVLSFNRYSFKCWYQNVYLVYPLNPEVAYQNNSRIPPYYGTGFAEGQHRKLVEFKGTLPEAIRDLDVDWVPFIRDNLQELQIVP